MSRSLQLPNPLTRVFEIRRAIATSPELAQVVGALAAKLEEIPQGPLRTTVEGIVERAKREGDRALPDAEAVFAHLTKEPIEPVITTVPIDEAWKQQRLDDLTTTLDEIRGRGGTDLEATLVRTEIAAWETGQVPPMPTRQQPPLPLL